VSSVIGQNEISWEAQDDRIWAADTDTRIEASFIDRPFPVPHFVDNLCYFINFSNITFIPFISLYLDLYGEVDDKNCPKGLIIPKITEDYFENKNFIRNFSLSSNSIYYKNELIIKNVSACLLHSDLETCSDIRESKYVSDVLGGAHFKYKNLGKRVDIYFYKVRGNLNTPKFKLCPLSINFGNWPNRVLFYDDGKPNKNIFFKEDFKKIPFNYPSRVNSLVLESKENAVLISYNKYVNDTFFHLFTNRDNEMIVSICSDSYYVNLSMLNGPHLHIFRKELYDNISKIFDEFYLYKIIELSVKIDTIYNYNGSEYVFNPTTFDNEIIVDIEFSNPSGIKWNPRIDYLIDGKIESYTKKDVSEFSFNKEIQLIGKHFQRMENILFPFSSYYSNLTINYFPPIKSDISDLDKQYEVKTSIEGIVMHMEVYPNKTFRNSAILYMLIFLVLIMVDLIWPSNFRLVFFLGAMISLIGFGNSYGFLSLPIIETYIYLGILSRRILKIILSSIIKLKLPRIKIKF
jgi:hypothetical protein